MRTINKSAVPLLAIILLNSCKLISGDNVKHVIPQSGLEYEIVEKADTDSILYDARFRNTGDLVYEENGKSILIAMDETGTITYQNNDGPEILFELLAFSPLPPKNTEINVGTKWVKLRPADADVAQMTNAVVGQEKVEYEVVSADKDEITMNIIASARVVNNVGLSTAFSNGGVPDTLFSIRNIPFSSYATGKIVFDVKNSRVKSAEGTRSPFGFLLNFNNMDVATDPLAVDYKISIK
jgi:hypothetical protein